MLNLLATLRGRLGTTLVLEGKRTEGLEQARRTIDVREELVKKDPHNAALLHDLMIAHSRLGDLSGGPFLSGVTTRDDAALACYRKALAIAE